MFRERRNAIMAWMLCKLMVGLDAWRQMPNNRKYYVITNGTIHYKRTALFSRKRYPSTKKNNQDNIKIYLETPGYKQNTIKKTARLHLTSGPEEPKVGKKQRQFNRSYICNWFILVNFRSMAGVPHSVAAHLTWCQCLGNRRGKKKRGVFQPQKEAESNQPTQWRTINFHRVISKTLEKKTHILIISLFSDICMGEFELYISRPQLL